MEKNGRIKRECSSNCLKLFPFGSYSNFEDNLLQFTFATELKPRISNLIFDDVSDQIKRKKLRKNSYENQRFGFHNNFSEKGSNGDDNESNNQNNDLKLKFETKKDNIAKKGKLVSRIGRTNTECYDNLQSIFTTTIMENKLQTIKYNHKL